MFSIKVAANPILEGHLEISVAPLETLSEYKSPDPAVERGSELKSTGTLKSKGFIWMTCISGPATGSRAFCSMFFPWEVPGSVFFTIWQPGWKWRWWEPRGLVCTHQYPA